MTQSLIKKCTVLKLEQNPNFENLLAEYAVESSIDGLPPPSARMETYKQLENTGKFHVWEALGDGILLGFITVLLSDLPHYGACVGVCESFFVGVQYRKTGAGLKLLRELESFVNSNKGVGLLVSAPFGGILAEVLPNVGYAETNRVFFKSFKDE